MLLQPTMLESLSYALWNYQGIHEIPGTLVWNEPQANEIYSLTNKAAMCQAELNNCSKTDPNTRYVECLKQSLPFCRVNVEQNILEA